MSICGRYECRTRRIPWPIQDARQCAQRIAQHASSERVAILFGREDRGLLTEELQRCNLHCHIPTHERYSSLNLAMAVQIVAYELRMLQVATRQGARGRRVGYPLCQSERYGPIL